MKNTKMKKKNWDGCSTNNTKSGNTKEVMIGFYKKTGTITFTKKEWESFKETVEWLFDPE